MAVASRINSSVETGAVGSDSSAEAAAKKEVFSRASQKVQKSAVFNPGTGSLLAHWIPSLQIAVKVAIASKARSTKYR